MEGRRSRSKPAEAEPGTPAVDAGKAALVDDRYVPTVGGENKRKRAPRGPAGGRNVKAKVEEEAAILDPAVEVEEVSGSRDEEKQRRGSSRLRIRPSKFRETSTTPASSSKVKGEARSSDENFSMTPPTKDDDQGAVQLVPSQVDTRELIARIFSRRKESNKLKGKDNKAAPIVPDQAGLKAVLLSLKRVMKMKEAEPFNKPVDPVKLGIPDYLEVVKKPMDLGTIRDRLEKGEVYTSVESVFEDVALVWSNCRQYNDGGDPIVGLLSNLESTFNKLCLAAGFPFHATNAAEANSEKPKGEDNIIPQQTDDRVKVPKKKKAKVAHPDVGATLSKTKVKRSAPVDQVMAESKAREQKNSGEELNVRDVLERDVKNAVESSSGADEQPQPEQRSEDEEVHDDDDDPEPVQEPVETPPVKEEESPSTRLHRKSTNAQHVIAPAKVKRPNGHSTLTHRQGCLCVVCVGRRKREAKLRKSGAHAKSNKSAKKKPGGPNSDDMAAEAEEALTFAEDGEDALNGSSPPENVQGYSALSDYQLPLRKLDPSVLEMSRFLLGSKPGSVWNRPRSLGYVAVPFPGKSIGIADAISFLSH